MNTRRVLGAALLIFAGACKSDQQKADDKRQTVESWHATVRMADSASARREVPRHFVERLHTVARKAIAQSSQP